MVIHAYPGMQKFGVFMSKSKDILPRSNSLWKYNLDIEVKGQGHTELTNVTSHHVDTLTCRTKFDYVKGQTRWVLNTKSWHKPYKFDVEVKGQGRIRIMNVLDTSSYGDRSMCQIWYANIKANRSYRSDMRKWQAYKNELEVEGQHRIWIMYTTHRLMVIYPCAKYGKPMSIQKKLLAGQNPIILTLRSKFKVVFGSWMYATHHLTVIHPCAKYGKPMSNQKKLWAGRESAQTDGRTDGQTDRQTDWQTDGRTDRQTDKQADRRTDWCRLISRYSPELRSRGV